jgi:superfamily II DNA or RNA helicase
MVWRDLAAAIVLRLVDVIQYRDFLRSNSPEALQAKAFNTEKFSITITNNHNGPLARFLLSNHVHKSSVVWYDVLKINKSKAMQIPLFTQHTIEPTSELKLRDYQINSVNQTHKFFEQFASVMLVSGTGTGKTMMSSKIIADYVAQGKRVLFCVHRGRLVKQTKATLNKYFGIDPSIIWADYGTPDYTNPVQIAMIQTLQNRELPPDIDLVIMDECHTGTYFSIWNKIMNNYSQGVWFMSKTKFLGLTATPWRSKKKEGYCQFFQAIVRNPSTEEMINAGNLCRARQFEFQLIDEKQLRVKDGEFTEDSMRKVCNEELNKRIVESYLEKDPDFTRKLICFCATVEQSKDLAERFNAAGIKSECIVGDTSQEQRDLIFSDYKYSIVKNITSVGVLCEGFDEPTVDAVLICRPVASRALWIQMCGRGLRLAENKLDCWILDFCGTLKRLKEPTANFPIQLCPFNDSNEPYEEPPRKICPKCGTSHRWNVKICRAIVNEKECGHIFKSEKPKASPQKQAKLVEFLSAEQKKQFKFLEKQSQNNYNSGKPLEQVENKFKEKFGYQPFEDWQDGLLFGNPQQWEPYVQFLWRHLLSTSRITDRNYLMSIIHKEFKSSIDKFKKHHKEYAEALLKERLPYKPWWVLLGLSEPCQDIDDLNRAYFVAKSQINKTYSQDQKAHDNWIILINYAHQEGVEYFGDNSNLDRLLMQVHSLIYKRNFSGVAAVVSRLELGVKEKLWQCLTEEERLLYRSWQREKKGSSAVNYLVRKIG